MYHICVCWLLGMYVNDGTDCDESWRVGQKAH